MPFKVSKLKKKSTKITIGYMYLEELFDTIFNMVYNAWLMGRENRPWPKGSRSCLNM